MPNIQNSELLERLARFSPLFQLQPVIAVTGQFIPANYSRGVFGDPVILRLMAQEFLHLVDFDAIDVVAGIELQGVPLAVAIGLEANKPTMLVREKPKRPGRSAIIGDANFIRSGTRVLLVDDIMAYGGTKEQRTAVLEEAGAIVTDIAMFTQTIGAVPPHKPLIEGYHYDAERWIASKGIRLHVLLTYNELMELQFRAGTIREEFYCISQHVVDGPYWEDREHLMALLAFMRREGVPTQDFVIEFMRSHGVEV